MKQFRPLLLFATFLLAAQIVNAACVAPSCISLVVTNRTGYSVKLNWAQTPGGTGYNIQVSNQTGYPYYWHAVTVGNVNNYTLNGLNLSNQYRYRVRTWCAAQNMWSPWSCWKPFSSGGWNTPDPGSSNVDDEALTELVQTSSVTATIAPNPANQLVNVFFSNESNLPRRVALLDLTGRLIQEETLEVGLMNTTLDLSTKSPGVYLIQIQENGSTETRKLVVMH